jgi:hypothetical protein
MVARRWRSAMAARARPRTTTLRDFRL